MIDSAEFWISAAVLVISALVLAVEVVVLRRISRETQERKHLISQLLVTQRVFTRSEYIRLIAEQVTRAQSEVKFVTSAQETEADREVLDVLEEAKERVMKKVQVYEAIIPKDASRLSAAWSLVQTGVKVYVHTDLSLSDLNFTMVDQATVVVGVPDRQGGPSSRGFVVHSGTLVELLRQYYARLRVAAVPFDDFAREAVSRMKELGFTDENVSTRTGIPLHVVKASLT